MTTCSRSCSKCNTHIFGDYAICQKCARKYAEQEFVASGRPHQFFAPIEERRSAVAAAERIIADHQKRGV